MNKTLNMPKRTVCWFSCGAASAVATKIAIDEHPVGQELVVVCTTIVREHDDNERFLKDCEAWFGRPILRTINEQYAGDPHEVFRRVRYLVGPEGAACTRLLKKGVRLDFERPGDKQVFGFTLEEQDRYDRFIDANNIDCDAPLIRKGLSKQDCLGMLDMAGIEIPAMYRLGYKNNNCIGCVKGGAGYWNKIRVDFPEAFAQVSAIEQELGHSVIRLVVGHEDVPGSKRKRAIKEKVFLKDLDPNVGRYSTEDEIQCGIACESAYMNHGAACEDL